jgi:DNA-binding NarL/FixJ family response regulator
MNITVLIVDDGQEFRRALKGLLDATPNMEVIGEAGDGLEAVERSLRLSPHVVIMDVVMPVLNGVDATRRIVEQNPSIKVLALSMHSDNRFVTEMFEAGASGYLLKDYVSEELTRAIHSIVAGQKYLSAELAARVSREAAQEPFPGCPQGKGRNDIP